MKKFGKTIKLFLIDGGPEDRTTYELSNWTAKTSKIPSIQIKNSYNRYDLQKAGVYLLFGKKDEGAPLMYIDEEKIIIDRLKQQIAQDYELSSPSTAASIILERTANGENRMKNYKVA